MGDKDNTSVKNRKGNERRVRISSGTGWEYAVGYSRAVRSGKIIEVSGTTAIDQDNKIVGRGDAYLQAKYVLQKIRKVLREAGGSIRDVTRTRIFLTDINLWQKVGKAHAEVFQDIRPVCTMVEVRSLIHPELCVEIEATAVVDE